MSVRMTWPEICQIDACRGRWVALDSCRYDQATMQPIEGEVVDADEDLASLCARMRALGQGSCAIRFCEGLETGSGSTRTPPSQRATTH